MRKHLKPITQSDRDALRSVPGGGEWVTDVPMNDTLQISLSPRVARLLIRALGLLLVSPGFDLADDKIAREWRVYLEQRLEGRT